MTLDRAVVTKAATIAGGTCRIEGIASPVVGSHIRFEVMLPQPGRWSGRYYQIGNGGFAGAIHEPTLLEGAERGDAIAGTDAGHSSNPFDASWAEGHPVQVDDYGWRSIKATSDAARALILRYYGKPAMRHYAIGCSNGGRMALMAAARWPDEWDGIIAGAPAVQWTEQLQAFARLQRQLRSDPASWIKPNQLDTIRAAALGGCPEGTVVGGIAVAPEKCSAVFSRLRCRAVVTNKCLTDTQLRSLAAIVRAGYLPAAMVPDDWARWIIAPASAQSQLTFAQQGNSMLANGEAALDIPIAGLAAFNAKGGKIISYFGWADAVIAPLRGIGWYKRVAMRTKPPASVQDYYRLFMVPGMVHCQGGLGPTQFGQSVEARAASDDATHDVRRALEAWVEIGRPPRDLIAIDGARQASRTLVPMRIDTPLP